MLKGVHEKIEASDNPRFFVRGKSYLVRLTFFSILSLLMIAIDSRFGYLEKFRSLINVATRPIEATAYAPSKWLFEFRSNLQAYQTLLDQNQKLKQGDLINQVQLQQLATLKAENDHLRKLLKGDAPLRQHAIMGEILSMERDIFSQIITLNRGSKHQVLAGQAVVDAEGVIGQVTRVFPYTSEVTLITDQELAIPIQIERNQLRAIAFGAGRNRMLDIPYLPTNVDIKVGDVLITSGIDGTYPPGLEIGKVTQITLSPDSPFAKIVIQPSAGVSTHLQVLILNYEAEKRDADTKATQAKIAAETLVKKPSASYKKTLLAPKPNE